MCLCVCACPFVGLSSIIVTCFGSHTLYFDAAYGPTGYGENDASGYNPSGQSSYEDGYGAQQVGMCIHAHCSLNAISVTFLCLFFIF